MPLRIEDYALVGDCETAALVGRNGSIDWLCWPRFDSDACFAALLGNPEHGSWCIAPSAPVLESARRYRGDTLILETDFETADGAVRVIDFMPLRGSQSDLVRIVCGLRGRVPMHLYLAIRFDYGETIPWVSRARDGRLRAVAGPHRLTLQTGVDIHGEGLATVADFVVTEGDRLAFVLTYTPSHAPSADAIDPEAALSHTEAFWRDWAGRCGDAGEWNGLVKRSLITLKALSYRPTGGIVAAVTTSLPEQLGGSRNWDYRFAWLRDSTFTLLALVGAGYLDEAKEWRDWLLRAVAGAPHQLRIMYGIAGERRLPEWEVPWLPGYCGASPVRIGNAAADQLQLDVFGEVADLLHQARREGVPGTAAGWRLQTQLADYLETIWQQADEGIWEVRSGRHQFTYSKVMAWVTFDRVIKSAEQFGLDGPLVRWRQLRQAVHADVCRQGFDAELGSFVQTYGSKRLDASLLLLPLVGFLPAADERIRGTVQAIERDLVIDGLVRRYDTEEFDDGCKPGEGMFLACTCWLADNLLLMGQYDRAREYFDRIVATANDVGLLSEEYDPIQQRLVGNFPQAFSHVALVNTAFNFSRGAGRADRRADASPTDESGEHRHAP